MAMLQIRLQSQCSSHLSSCGRRPPHVYPEMATTSAHDRKVSANGSALRNRCFDCNIDCPIAAVPTWRAKVNVTQRLTLSYAPPTLSLFQRTSPEHTRSYEDMRRSNQQIAIGAA